MKNRTAPAIKKKQTVPSPKGNGNILLYLVLFGFAFILYGNTLTNGYALDDNYVITLNKFTKKGFEGIPDLLGKDFFAGRYGDEQILLAGGRYRPLSMVTFAMEVGVFGEKPGVSHFFNILLYALTGVFLFRFLKKLMDNEGKKNWFVSVPVIASLLFMAHPVHTEVVANIKGRDEILSLLGSLLAANQYLGYLSDRKRERLGYAFLFFFLAAMSKENAFLFILLVPLSVYFFRPFRWKENLTAVSPLVLGGLLFLVIRMIVLSGSGSRPSTELLDNPFIEASFAQHWATILMTLGIYLKLLFIPHPLTWDYYPYHIPLVDFTDLRVIVSILVYLFLVFLAFRWIRKKSMLSFAVLWFLISIFLVSNIVFPIGVFMAERFLYTASVGFSVFIAWLLIYKVDPFAGRLLKRPAYTGRILLVAMLLVFTVRTIARNPVWKDDYTLFTTDVKVSENSAKGNSLAGQWYAWAANQPGNQARKQEYFARALKHLQRAVEIHPVYQDALFHLGNVYFDHRKDIDSTLSCYFRILRLDPEEENVYRNLNLILNNIPGPEERIWRWEQVLALNPSRFEPNYALAGLLASTDLKRAASLMEKARTRQPEKPEVLTFLGDAWFTLGDPEKAATYYESALKVMPGDTVLKHKIRVCRPSGK